MTILANGLSYFQCIEMAVFDTSTLTGTYQVLNGPSSYEIYTGSGFESDIKFLKMFNGGTLGITISYDGVKRNDFMPPNSTLILDIQAGHADNSAYGSGTLNGRTGQQIWGLGTAGVGNLYISGYR